MSLRVKEMVIYLARSGPLGDEINLAFFEDDPRTRAFEEQQPANKWKQAEKQAKEKKHRFANS